MKTLVIIGVVWLLTVGTSSALAQSGIYVEFYSFAQSRWVNVPDFPNRNAIPPEPGRVSGSHISINNVNAVPYRVFAVNPTNTSIGSITMDGTGGVVASLIVGRDFIFPNSGSALPTAGASSIGPIQSFGSAKIRLQASAEVSITGTISVYEVVRLDTPTLSGNVNHNPGADAAAPILGRVQAGSMGNVLIRSFRGDIGTVRCTGTSQASVQADQGNINFIDVDGNMTGSVGALTGSLFTLVVDGDLGTSSLSPVISARDEIRRVSVGRAWATILSTGNTATSGILRNVTTTSGPFVGTISARRMEGNAQQSSGISIAGNLDANVTFTDALIAQFVTVAGNYPATRTFRVGGGWAAGQTLTVSGPLAGQVMLNANDLGSTWTGAASANSVSLTPVPKYAALSSALGGGAVGEVPFNLHKEDSLPANGSGACSYPSRNWVNCGSGSTDIRDTLVLRHYGPIVVQNSGGNPPVKVERQSLVQQCNPLCTPAPWEDVTTQVDICVAPTEGSTPRPRELWIARKRINGVAQTWWGGYQIRVSLMPNDTNPYLRSSGTLAASAPIIAGYPYSFGTLCDELLGLSAGGWTNDDIAAWGATPTDLNNDGVADASDLALLVNLVTQTEQGGGWGNPPTE